MIRVSVLGATGYAGIELVRLLASHPEAELVNLVSQSFAGEKISKIYPNFRHVLDMECASLDTKRIAEESDVVFTALPHGASKTVIPELYGYGVKIIDLSGDFRYNDEKVYEEWYGEPHTNPELMKKAVYGLCELHREEIKKADIIGNPGCYTTCSILGSAPLFFHKLIKTDSVIIDAKSGVTGAGRSTLLDNSFCECTENMKAYKIATHRHTSEIEQECSLLAGEQIALSFTPHLIPLKRGILATIYATLAKPADEDEVLGLYREFYQDEHFVRVYEKGQLPETNHVAGSNFVDIGLKVDKRLKRIVVVSCIDNLVKGAAGQAVQNMNLMFGLPEDMGISNPGFYL